MVLRVHRLWQIVLVIARGMMMRNLGIRTRLIIIKMLEIHAVPWHQMQHRFKKTAKSAVFFITGSPRIAKQST